MRKLKPTTVILVTLFSFILLSILAPETVGDNDPSITEVTPIELGTITSNYYHMSDDSFDRLYSSDGKLKLSYNTEALLKVNLSSADPGIDSGDLEICLLPVEDGCWESLGDDGTAIDLKTFTNTDQTWDFVEYQLRYLPDGNDRPGNYSFSLNFELIQVGLVIKIQGNPRPGKKVNIKVSDHNGPVGNATIKLNDENVGTTNPGGVLDNLTFPEDEEEVTITATHDGRKATREINFEEEDEEDEDEEEEEEED